ncbi:hypothetical protein ABTM15_19865, partial [Acinetobacter baumannii]
ELGTFGTLGAFVLHWLVFQDSRAVAAHDTGQMRFIAVGMTGVVAIITVSTNVLMAGAIKFAPDIPKRTLDAASKLGLGSYDHIVLQL